MKTHIDLLKIKPGLILFYLTLISLSGIITCSDTDRSTGLTPREITEVNDGSQHGPMGPIPDGPGLEELPLLIGDPATANPLPPKDMPEHPYLAVSGGVHVDGYNTDVSDWEGPLGRDPEVFSRSMGVIGGEPGLGICLMRAFHPDDSVSSICYYVADLSGQLVTLGMDLVLFDPVTLEPLDFYATGEVTLDVSSPGDMSGVYFYVDNRGRAVVASPGNTIRIVEPGLSEGIPRWKTEIVLDLSDDLPEDAGNLIAVGPDFQGNIWFATQLGVIGYFETTKQRIYTVKLKGEKFENAFSTAPDGIYAATDYALYRFEIDTATGSPHYIWRQGYERATQEKPGMLSRGTGTTPTLLGDDLVALTDNADEQVNLLVFRRLSGEEICRIPLFNPGESVVEISPIGYRDAGGSFESVIVQNNYNAPTIYSDYTSLATGLVRVDVLPDRSGCIEVWSNDDFPATTVPKLSTATGLIYTYTQLLDTAVDRAWYLTAVDFRTGETKFMIRAGTGTLKHNYFATTEIGPHGIVYQGVVGGIIAARDGNNF
ncbi:MAG: hypothetical protein JSU92_13415 [Deltaproteobacteria bacterium]|nr:MAG: hypothetical protein JSU92_13415 [Deltaproteobacteria bacterium]